MMTEEQKQALIKHNIAKINSITPQFMKEVLPGVKRHLQCEIDSAKLALDSLRTALTQPASPALKLPDAKPDHDSEDGNDIDYLEPSQVYALGVDDGFNRCLREVVKLNAPHTAPIEPICATGGAEWVKVPREPTRQMMSQGHFAMAGTDRGKFRRIYQAMIAAAPQPK